MPDFITQISQELRALILRQIRRVTALPFSQKTAVVLAIGTRATRLNEALFILNQAGFSEEAAALLRVLIEVVVNGAYLMVTGEKGFKAFVAHPLVLMGKHHQAYLEHSEDQNSFTEEFDQMLATSAAEAANFSGKTLKDTSWTSESVSRRADAADAVFKHGLFPDLARTAYVGGHDFIHGNYPAIAKIVDAIQGEPLQNSADGEGDVSVVHGATLSLLGYALSLNQHFKPEIYA